MDRNQSLGSVEDSKRTALALQSLSQKCDRFEDRIDDLERQVLSLKLEVTRNAFVLILSLVAGLSALVIAVNLMI